MTDEKAPFNSALDLLERLSDILRHITKVKQNLLIDQNEKQGLVLELVKDYYIQSIPLLSKDGRTDYKKILKLTQKEATLTKNNRRTTRKIKIYSSEVESEINEALINIQMNLQDVGGYFMPQRRKLGGVVGDFH